VLPRLCGVLGTELLVVGGGVIRPERCMYSALIECTSSGEAVRGGVRRGVLSCSCGWVRRSVPRRRKGEARGEERGEAGSEPPPGAVWRGGLDAGGFARRRRRDVGLGEPFRPSERARRGDSVLEGEDILASAASMPGAGPRCTDMMEATSA